MQISQNLTPRYLVWFTLVMIAAGRGFADDPTPEVHELTYGEAAEVQMDASRLEDAESLIESSVADGEIPGAVILVARRGKIVLHKAFGWRDVDRRVPMSRDTLFRMASNSKAVTAAGILLLVEDGKIGLDQPVGNYLPAFARDSWAKVSVRQLLTEQGTFSHSGSDGTFAWVDPQLDVVGLVLLQAQGTTIPRRTFRELVSHACVDVYPDSSNATRVTEVDGFYKDIFMSGGANLTSRKTLHAAESLGLTYEYYAGKDPVQQNKLLIGTADDENGLLLYPDGQPRFRMLYVNGGAATKHGMSLTPGKWFVSVQCASTVRAVNDPDSGFYRYFKDRNVLNGIAYTIQITHHESENDEIQH